MKESNLRLADKIAHGNAILAARRASEKEEVYHSPLQELSSDDSDTPDDLRASPVQRDYPRKQELIVLALFIALVVISLVALYLLWIKATLD